MPKPHILIANDDGIDAVGIIALAQVFAREYRVTVVAPLVEQSGKSHAFTYREPIQFEPVSFPVEGVDAFAVNGTPSDCVKVALGYILDEMPDFVISGINCGFNSGIATFYSGTIGAAREGAFWRIPSVAFSTTHEYTTLDEMLIEAEQSLTIFNKLNNDSLLKPAMNHFYSVNFPGVSSEQCKGIKIVPQSCSYYDDTYTKESDTNGKVSLTMTGELIDIEDGIEHDVTANMNSYISITPLSIDSTAWSVMESLTNYELSFDIKELK